MGSSSARACAAHPRESHSRTTKGRVHAERVRVRAHPNRHSPASVRTFRGENDLKAKPFRGVNAATHAVGISLYIYYMIPAQKSQSTPLYRRSTVGFYHSTGGRVAPGTEKAAWVWFFFLQKKNHTHAKRAKNIIGGIEPKPNLDLLIPSFWQGRGLGEGYLFLHAKKKVPLPQSLN